MTKNNGGQAFPGTRDKTLGYNEGMTLRDYFAGQALGGMVSNPEARHNPERQARGC